MNVENKKTNLLIGKQLLLSNSPVLNCNSSPQGQILEGRNCEIIFNYLKKNFIQDTTEDEFTNLSISFTKEKTILETATDKRNRTIKNMQQALI